MERDLLVVTVLGRDREGLVAHIAEVTAIANANIIDVEQNVIHGLFSMFMLIDISNSNSGFGRICADLLRVGKSLNVEISITPFGEYGRYNPIDGKSLQAITVMGVDRPGIVAGVSKSLYDLGANIERMRMIARGELITMEMIVDSKEIAISSLRQEMRRVGESLGVDIIVQPEDISRWRKQLVVFDMDGTIVDAEIIDEMAGVAGVGREVSEITAKGMRGEIEFKESLKKRVAMLKGMPVSKLKKIRDNMKLTPGSEELIRTLKDMGFKLALISGGFSYFTDALKEKLGFDYAYGNELVISNGKLTGKVRGRIIDSRRKAEILNELARKEGISRKEIVAIGDGANDRIMLKNAGLGIAFNAKDVLKEVADGSITKKNLKGLMYCLGINGRM